MGGGKGGYRTGGDQSRDQPKISTERNKEITKNAVRKPDGPTFGTTAWAKEHGLDTDEQKKD